MDGTGARGASAKTVGIAIAFGAALTKFLRRKPQPPAA